MVYSKTRLGADQLSGGPRLSRRGKMIVFSLLGVVLAAAISLGIWSAVGCVNFNIPNTMGGALIHYCGSQAVDYCRSAYASSDKLSLLGRAQCEQAGLTRAKVAAGWGFSPYPQRARFFASQLQDERDRAVVDERDLHVGAELPRLDVRAQVPERADDRVDQRLRDRAWRGRLPGGAAALVRVAVQGELADDEQRCAEVCAGLLAVENAQAPELPREFARNAGGVVVGDADQHEQPRSGALVDRAGDLTVDGDAGLGHPLHDCSHEMPA